MKLKQGIRQLFSQLSDSIQQLSPAEFTRPIPILFNASIGQHVRHILELFICLQNGYETGIVNYDKRKRDLRIETDQEFALALLKSIYDALNKPNIDLILEANYDEDEVESVCIGTNYFREIAYNLEHTVHHMALIRVGINAVSSISLPESFGVASSTSRHLKGLSN